MSGMGVALVYKSKCHSFFEIYLQFYYNFSKLPQLPLLSNSSNDIIQSNFEKIK